MDTAKQIKELRASTGMSRKEFSEHTGIPVRTLEDWKDVREYLKEYVGEFYTIASTGDAIYIGSDLPKEYSGKMGAY